MKYFRNWTEVSKGYFKYVIDANFAYEIFIEYWSHDTPIETARASLCVIGVWRNKTPINTTERKWIAKDLPICELVKIAYEDDTINNLKSL